MSPTTFSPQHRSHVSQVLNNDRDAEATAIADKVMRGQLDSADARWQLYSLLAYSSIVEQAATFCSPPDNQQVHLDAVQYIQDLLERKLITDESFIDLERFAHGASLSGWCRQLLSSETARHDIRRRLSRHLRESATGDSENLAPPAGLDGDHFVEGDSEPNADVIEAIATDYITRVHGLRDSGKAHLIAETLCRLYGFPLPARGVDLADSRSLLATCDADELAAQSDLRAMLTSPGHRPSGLAILFCTWEPGQVEQLASLRPGISQAIARSGLIPKQRLSFREAEALTSAVMTSVGKDTALRLVGAYVELTSELDRSEFDKTRRPTIKPLTRREADMEAFTNEVSDLVNRGVSALGMTPDEVASSLGSVLDSLRLQKALAA